MTEMYYPPDTSDNWKNKAQGDKPVVLRQRTRAEQQAWLDEQISKKQIDWSHWRMATDRLSNVDALGNPY